MMGLPNVGVTGVIQDPGLGGTFARGLGGIAQMIQQQQEIARQQEQQAYQRKLQQDQLKLQQDAAAARLRGEQQVGQGLTDLMTPATRTVNTDSVTGMPFGDQSVQVPQSIEAVMAKMDPQFRAQFLEASQPIVQDRKAKAEQAKQERAYDEAVRDLPEALRGPMKMAIRLKVNNLVPAEVIGDVYRRSLAASNSTPEQMATMRTKYPEFAELPDDELVRAVAEIAELQVKSRLGVLYKPSSGGSGGGGGTPTGMTPQQKQKMAALEKEISDARIRLGAYKTRAPVARETVDPITRRVYPPLNEAAGAKHVADSSAAHRRYETAINAKAALQAEINGEPVAPGQMTVPQLASMVNEALRAIRASAMSPEQKQQAEQEALAQYRQDVMQLQGR